MLLYARGVRLSRPAPTASTPPGLVLLAALVLVPACSGVVEPAPAGPRDTIGLAYEPGPATLPRLTAAQYRSTLEDLFGEALPATPVEPDTNPYLFFTIGAASTTLSEVGAQQYEENAHRVAAYALDPARRDALVGCAPSGDGTCERAFVTRIGRRILRRPLEPEEIDRWLGVTRDLADGDPWRGLRYALAGLLMSPSFLYRVELGVPGTADPSRARLGDFELASRLSFLLWNTAPDDELLDAAARGELATEDGVYAHALRLLEHPRARVAVQEFFAQYLDLGRLDHVDRDPALYALASPTLPRSMRTEMQLLVDDIVFRRDADLREIFATRRTFVNLELAALYGVEEEAAGATPITFVPVELPESSGRAGILTLGAFLAANAHPTETSPTLRGKYVRERILCELVPPPPPGVVTEIEPSGEMPRTLRERLEEHRTNPACAACHASIDPPGFLFEGFDSIGARRTHDHGVPVDTSGELDGAPLRDGRDLGAILAEDPRVTMCLTRQLWRHAHARLETDGEEAAIVALERAFARSGYRFRDLLIELAISDAFRSVASSDAGAGAGASEEGGATP